MLEINKIYHGDCMTYMPQLEDNSVNLTLTVIGFRPMDSEIIYQIGRKYHFYA